MYVNLFLILVATASMTLPEESTFIEGLVADKGSDLVLAGVIVRWKGTSHSVLTDAEGRYRISRHEGIKKLVFSKPGWNDKTFRVRKSGTRDIFLKKPGRGFLPAQPEEDLPPDSLSWLH